MEAKTLHWWGHTDRGRVRKNNEDSFLCLQFDAQEVRYLGKIGDDTLEARDFVFAVSDGMGGAQAGEFASQIAVEKITRILPRAFRHGATGMNPGWQDVLTEVFAEIHKALLYLGESYAECSGMGATLTLCWFTPGWMYFGHIGDTRLYYLSSDATELKQISHDDTHVGWLRRQGKLSEREARSHPRRTALAKAVGAGHQFAAPQLGAVGYEAGDAFFLCSDGVNEGLFDRQILRELRDPAPGDAAVSPAQRVVKTAVEQSGRDNTTALYLEAH